MKQVAFYNLYCCIRRLSALVERARNEHPASVQGKNPYLASNMGRTFGNAQYQYEVDNRPFELVPLEGLVAVMSSTSIWQRRLVCDCFTVEWLAHLRIVGGMECVRACVCVCVCVCVCAS